MVYGYCRISTNKQSIDRQIRNIKASYPEAVIVEEVYTGTKFQGRDKLDKIIKTVKDGDVIVFDSVSRMSRNAEEGMQLYREMFDRGISLVFLKEPHINTDTYKAALSNQLNMTGDDVETSWLIDRGVEVLGDAEYEKKITPVTQDLAAAIYKVAWNGHSLANECEKGVVNDHRIWWVQAESIVYFICVLVITQLVLKIFSSREVDL